ncbi:glucose-6-phosphate isomerase 1, chloroplastic isoform X2 [Rosa chinensis]|uniref:glucose-6-phosphate isomerase 1, chloroplastic isoform X2 n=1 Tax=Rosa chinensis TaxID=74649 RepID=UPI000D0974E6|nr:glucose-6-phosphate isomerase 1, chloroplastic isoform X2 [Rosa chinensis]
MHGVHNFFVTFIEELQDRPPGHDWELEPGVTCGDYLFGMLQGTRSALYSNDRESLTVSVEEVTPRSVGALIALYEKAVGIYASLVNINAYHQLGSKHLLEMNRILRPGGYFILSTKHDSFDAEEDLISKYIVMGLF